MPTERALYRQALRRAAQTGEPFLTDMEGLLNPNLISEFLGRRWKHSENEVYNTFSITNSELGRTLELEFPKVLSLRHAFSLSVDPGRNAGGSMGFEIPIESIVFNKFRGKKGIQITSGELTLDVMTSELYLLLFRSGSSIPIAHADLRHQLGFPPAIRRRTLE